MFDIIFDCKSGIIIFIPSKVDGLQYQEHVANKNVEQKRILDITLRYTDKISSQELKNEYTLVLCVLFDK